MHDDKIIEVLARVEDEKARFERREKGALGFDMDVWYSQFGDGDENICGTTACLAGHAAVSDGYHLRNSTDCAKQDGTYPKWKWTDHKSIEQAGREVLGLTGEQADDLFYLGNLDDVYMTLADWMNVDEIVLRDKVQASRKMVP